jgi:hypothetical protein
MPKPKGEPCASERVGMLLLLLKVVEVFEIPELSLCPQPGLIRRNSKNCTAQLTITKTVFQEMEERIEEEEREMAKSPNVNWNSRRKVRNMLKWYECLEMVAANASALTE